MYVYVLNCLLVYCIVCLHMVCLCIAGWWASNRQSRQWQTVFPSPYQPVQQLGDHHLSLFTGNKQHTNNHTISCTVNWHTKLWLYTLLSLFYFSDVVHLMSYISAAVLTMCLACRNLDTVFSSKFASIVICTGIVINYCKLVN